MVIKTEPCAFTEVKIYPGRGSKFASRDGKIHYFITSKARSLYHQKIKPVKLTWTQASRRFNKKVKIDDVQKKRTRKTTRVQKAIVGLSLDDFKRKRFEDEKTREKNHDAAVKELKDRQQKKIQQKKAEKAKINKANAAQKTAPAKKVQKGGRR